jgi:hypothetical protein
MSNESQKVCKHIIVKSDDDDALESVKKNLVKEAEMDCINSGIAVTEDNSSAWLVIISDYGYHYDVRRIFACPFCCLKFGSE